MTLPVFMSIWGISSHFKSFSIIPNHFSRFCHFLSFFVISVTFGGLNWNWWVPRHELRLVRLEAWIESDGSQGLNWNKGVLRLELRLVNFRASIKTSGVSSMKLFMSHMRLRGDGFVHHFSCRHATLFSSQAFISNDLPTCRKHYRLPIAMKTWPYTLPPSRGRVRRSGIARKRSHFDFVTNRQTDRQTDRPTDRHSKF